MVVETMGGTTALGRRDRLVALVDGPMDLGIDNGSIDAVAALAFPVTATMACELTGLPADTVLALWPRAGDLCRAMTPVLPGVSVSGPRQHWRCCVAGWRAR